MLPPPGGVGGLPGPLPAWLCAGPSLTSSSHHSASVSPPFISEQVALSEFTSVVTVPFPPTWPNRAGRWPHSPVSSARRPGPCVQLALSRYHPQERTSNFGHEQGHQPLKSRAGSLGRPADRAGRTGSHSPITEYVSSQSLFPQASVSPLVSSGQNCWLPRAVVRCEKAWPGTAHSSSAGRGEGGDSESWGLQGRGGSSWGPPSVL